MVENGTNIRCIQTLLGHVRLETTRLYTHVAGLSERQVRSPLDVLTANGGAAITGPAGRSACVCSYRKLPILVLLRWS